MHAHLLLSTDSCTGSAVCWRSLTKIRAFTHRKNIQTGITYHRHFLEGGNTSWNPVLLMVHAPHVQH